MGFTGRPMSNSVGTKEIQSDFDIYKYSFSPFYNNMQRTLHYIIWCICRHVKCTQGVQNHGNTAFYPHKIHIAKSLYIFLKSLVSLVLHHLGLCLQFSPLFSRHMSFFCQIKFTFRQLASIENALITSIDSNLGG